jgi:hypothetical protein
MVTDPGYTGILGLRLWRLLLGARHAGACAIRGRVVDPGILGLEYGVYL